MLDVLVPVEEQVGSQGNGRTSSLDPQALPQQRGLMAEIRVDYWSEEACLSYQATGIRNFSAWEVALATSESWIDHFQRVDQSHRLRLPDYQPRRHSSTILGETPIGKTEHCATR